MRWAPFLNEAAGREGGREIRFQAAKRKKVRKKCMYMLTWALFSFIRGLICACLAGLAWLWWSFKQLLVPGMVWIPSCISSPAPQLLSLLFTGRGSASCSCEVYSYQSCWWGYSQVWHAISCKSSRTAGQFQISHCPLTFSQPQWCSLTFMQHCCLSLSWPCFSIPCAICI